MIQGGLLTRTMVAGIRGLLLWIVIPVGTLAWIFVVVWMRVSLGAFLGWIDINVFCALGRIFALQRFGVEIFDWVPWSEARSLKHRIVFLDLW